MKKTTISVHVTPALLEELYVAQRLVTTSRSREAKRTFDELNRLIVTIAQVLQRQNSVAQAIKDMAAARRRDERDQGAT